MRQVIVIANWKMNPGNLDKANALFDLVKKGIPSNQKAEVVICPPYIYLNNLKKRTNSFLKFGAQDCFWEKKGAYTGGISALMLKNLGCKYVIIGHSDRRRYFNETNEAINKKLKAVLNEKMVPVLCIGETKEQRSKGQTKSVLRKQIKSALNGINISGLKNLEFCIVYEPIWAIGSKNPCDVKEIQKIALFIRRLVAENYNAKIAEKISILYGGSVVAKNVFDYIDMAGLQGVVVGGASLDAKEFVKIVEAVS